MEQRALGASPDQGLGELEVRDRRFVEHDRVRGIVGDELGDRQRADWLGRLRVRDHGRRGAQCERSIVEV